MILAPHSAKLNSGRPVGMADTSLPAGDAMSSTHFRLVALICFLCLLPATRQAISAEEPAAKRPGAVWAASPIEIVFAFPDALDESVAKIAVGKEVSCYDGKIVMLPTGRRYLGALSIGGAKLTDGGRTLTLATDPHSVAGGYLILMTSNWLATYDLSGVEIAWFAGEEPDFEADWKGWLPTLDPAASQKATLGSAPHERWFADMAKVGHLRLDAQAKLPAGTTRLTIESSAPITECFSGEGEPENGVEKTEGGGSRAVFSVADASAPLFLSLTVQTGGAASPPTIRATFSAEGGGEARELTREDLILPWAVPVAPSAGNAEIPIPDLAGGDPARGKTVFFSDEALCSRCHAFEGTGGTVGPDVKEMREKSLENLYRSIAAPSDEVAPQYVPFTVSLKDGRVVAGVARAEGADALRVTDSDAKETIVSRAEIDDIRPGSASIMPVGLLPVLGEDKVRDLIAFLKSGDNGAGGIGGGGANQRSD